MPQAYLRHQSEADEEAAAAALAASASAAAYGTTRGKADVKVR
jgi:hypothetical protein